MNSPTNMEQEQLMLVACFVAAWEVWDYTENWTLAGLTFFVPIVLWMVVKTGRKHLRERALLESGIDVIDQMSGIAFEELLLAHFRAMGYRGEMTPETGDYGADLILEKDNQRIVVQAKRWKLPVGIEAIQQAIGAVGYYNANRGMVITNSVYTPNAQELAKASGIELIEREQLIQVLRNSQRKDLIRQQGERKEPQPEKADRQTGILPNEQCPVCGKILVARSGKYGTFVGCSGFPGCRFTRQGYS